MVSYWLGDFQPDMMLRHLVEGRYRTEDMKTQMQVGQSELRCFTGWETIDFQRDILLKGDIKQTT